MIRQGYQITPTEAEARAEQAAAQKTIATYLNAMAARMGKGGAGG